MRKKLLSVASATMIFLFMYQSASAQSVAINATGAQPAPSAILDVASTNKGFLPPRMTSAQKLLIPSPDAGLMVFQTDNDSGYYYYNAPSATWLKFVTVNTNLQIPVVHTYTSNATWIKPTGLKYITVELAGGGGGGGGCYGYGGGSGAGGGYSKKIILATNLNPSETIIIGSGGNGGLAESAGLDGGTTSFGNHCYATGGKGGKAQTSTNINTTDGSMGGMGVNGDINIPGQPGGGAVNLDYPRYAGGSSFFGGGAIPRASDTPMDGANATGCGSGGSGGSGLLGAGNSAVNKIGGNGSKGLVIITEFY